MISKTSGRGQAGKTRGTLFLAIFLMLTFLGFSGGEAAAVTWQPQGPSPIQGGEVVIPPDNPVVGAVQSLLIDPTNNNIMYAGAVNGGIWKTTDGGSTWVPLTDTQISLSMGGMALDPTNPNHILAGFGHYSNFGGNGGPLAGVIFSSDAGNTWTPVGGAVTANTDVSSVVINVNSSVTSMFVASRSVGQGAGLFRSTDDGKSFIQISGSGGLPTGSVTSLASDPSNSNRIYAAVLNGGIFRSDNDGQTWTNITPAGSGIGTSGTDTKNIQLSVGANGQSLFMGLATPMGTTPRGTTGDRLQSVWRSLDHGATWQNMGGQGSGPGQGLPGTIENGAFVGINNDGQAVNNFALRADPQNPNTVYISGDSQPSWNEINADPTRPDFPNQIGATSHNASIYRGNASLDLNSPPTVGNWTPTTPFNGQWLPVTDNFANGTTPHADSRTLTFDANGNLLETNDGGIYRRSLPQSSNGVWTSLIGNLQVTEIYGLSYDSNTHTLISTNQDVGVSAQNQNSNGTPSATWTAQLGADGGSTAVNDQNPTFSVRYVSSQALSSFTRIKVDLNNNIIEKVPTTLKVGDETLQTGPSTDIPRQAPVRVNQDDMSMLAIGTNVVYLTTDDVNASPLSPVLHLTSLNTTPFASPVGDIAYGRPGNANLLLAAEGADLWLSTTLQVGSLKKLDKYPGPNTDTTSGTITSVCINPNFDNQFYVADGNTVRNTIDGGTDWTTGLSLSQLRSLQFVANGTNNFLVAGGYGTLYAARDTDLNDWYSLKGNLPNTFVWQMAYSSSDDVLAVGTVGRGAFTLANASTLMPATTPTSVDIGWIRLLQASSGDQTLNGGTVQNPGSGSLAMNFTLTSLGGTFDTSGANANSYNSGTSSTLTGLIAGPGSFTITGPGTLFLRHDNTYSGGTILNEGTLNVTNDNNLGATTGGLSFNGGTLQTPASFSSARSITLQPYGGTFDTNTSTAALTLTGIISGTGTLTKTGDGLLALLPQGGPNTYSGGTLLNGGTLQVTNDANLGAATGPLSFNGGTLQAVGGLTTSRTLVVLDNGGTLDTGTSASVLNGDLFGYKTFTQLGSGAGSVTLAGDGSPFTGTYAVGTSAVSGGTFVLNSALGSASGPCSLVIYPGSTWSGNGSLVGSLNLQGDGSGFLGSTVVPATSTLNGNGSFKGSLDLEGNGANFGGTYTLTSGAFTLNNALGSMLAPCSVVINPGTTLSGNGLLVGSLDLRGDGSGFIGSTVVPSASTLSGTGALAGSLNLMGNGANYGGAYTVTSGTFTLNNTMGGNPTPCSVVVEPGAFMKGNGTLVGTLTNRGTISPGHSPGTLNVVGSYTQTPSGTYIAEIASPSSYDRITVTGAPGTASLSGTLAPVLLGGYQPQGNTVFSGVVSATGGINGTFSSLTNQTLSPTLFWQPRYTADSLDLVVQRDYTNAGLGLNANQLAVGTMLNSVAGANAGDLNTVLNAIDSLPNAAAVQDAYKQISPEKAGALADLGFVAANFQVRNLATRTTNLRFVQGGSGGASSLAPGGLSCNYSRLDGVMLAYNGGFLPDLFTARREFKAPESPWGLFADGGAAFGTQSSTSNQTGYNFTLGGLTLGADYRVSDHFLVGLATGYSNTASSFYGTGGSVTVNTIPFNAYAAYFSGSLYAYGSLGYALNLYDLRRGLSFEGIDRTASSSTTGNQFNLYGETGYDLKLRQFILTPAATLTYSALWLGGFSEQNAGALNLKVGAQNVSSVQTGVGGRITVPLKMGSVLMAPQAYAFYQHEFANGSRGLNASLSQGSSTFTWQTDAAGQNFALVGASLTAGLKENLYAQVNFNAEVGRRNATAHYVNAGLRYEF